MKHSTEFRPYAPAGVNPMEARLALRMTSRLSEVTSELPADVSERLRFARERALERARAVRAAQPVTAGDVLVSGATLSLGAGPGRPRWLKQMAAALPLAVLVAGLMLIQRMHDRAQIAVAAEIDASLLADDLPPSAYSDPGFVEFLKAPRD